MSKRYKESLERTLIRLCEENMKNKKQKMKNNNTRKTYTHKIRAFCDWAKEQGWKRYEKIEHGEKSKVEIIQEYADYLDKNKKTPATIHTMISPICVAMQVEMSRINKPKRTINEIKRGRRNGEEKDGDRQAKRPEFFRIVSFQEGVGIRRDELERLLGRDLVDDESGYPCVFVEKGKGGKSQFQRIHPGYEENVKATFEGIEPDQRVFSKEELDNKINFHGMRAAGAKEMYKYYVEMIRDNPDQAQKLIDEIVRRWDYRHPPASAESRSRFINEMTGHNKIYKLRGKSLEAARKKGLPTEYDRLALMAVSVFHLSHWRLPVTVTNYILA